MHVRKSLELPNTYIIIIQAGDLGLQVDWLERVLHKLSILPVDLCSNMQVRGKRSACAPSGSFYTRVGDAISM